MHCLIPVHPRPSRWLLMRCRAAMTLVEMLVAMAVTLIMMAAIAQLFGTLGQGVNGTRSLTEIDDRMRAVAFRLRYDLEGLTAPVFENPPLRPEQNMGYFEYIEGPVSDGSSVVPYTSGDDDRLRGDIDDVLLFTTRSPSEHFSGRCGGRSIRSPVAEVIWYCRKTANTFDPELYTLYRRQRVVMAHPGVPPFIDPGNPNTVPFSSWADLHTLTDVACRLQGDFAVPNSLGDLTKRENRFCRDVNFPFRFLMDKLDVDNSSSILTFDESHPRFGEDAVLTNVIGFDVRVFDLAPSRSAGAHLLFPGDVGYSASVTTPVNALGGGQWPIWAPVDLAWQTPSSNPAGIGGGFPPAGSLANELGLRTRGVRVKNGTMNLDDLSYPPTYCTWSSHYESNEIDEDGDGLIDEGDNGRDDDMNGRIDELGEAETSAPYPVGLNGIEVRIRCYEPSSRQVRQVTIRHTFVPH